MKGGYWIWIMLIIAVVWLCIQGLVFLSRRTRRIGFVSRIYEKNKHLGRLVSLFPLAICLPFGLINGVTVLVVFIHLFVFWVMCDLIGFCINKIRKRERGKHYINGFIAIGLTAVYLGIGWYFAHHIFRTDYTLHTDKPLGQESFRVALIADTHIGEVLDSGGLADVVERINADEPDIAAVCGDLVDDGTSESEMKAACEALGRLKTKYGVYYVYGNHDKGYNENRGYDADDVARELEKNGVKVLADETELINGSVYLVGRRDRSEETRSSAQELTEKLDRSKYIIMLDHQPNDQSAEAKSGADLVLSGHTHGGHIFPIGPASVLFGANDQVYGLKRKNGTDFIVTSGVSGWEIPFKTFARSEYVIIDIEQE